MSLPIFGYQNQIFYFFLQLKDGDLLLAGAWVKCIGNPITVKMVGVGLSIERLFKNEPLLEKEHTLLKQKVYYIKYL